MHSSKLSSSDVELPVWFVAGGASGAGAGASAASVGWQLASCSRPGRQRASNRLSNTCWRRQAMAFREACSHTGQCAGWLAAT